MLNRIELRPIKTEADYDAALAAIDRLTAGDREPEEGTPESDLIEILITLVQAYESLHYPMAAPDPIEAIKFRMEQRADPARPRAGDRRRRTRLGSTEPAPCADPPHDPPPQRNVRHPRGIAHREV
ncbi:MAG TPA: hypothetical protein VGP50_17530 [Stellaceae bacterium]|jgi:hypothetical protein|nr:hypothetical protein [Stellaceae bacterium]